MHVIAHIKQLCAAAEKQYFVFLMGKLNPAKLANFSEVDVYCLIACHENSMVS
jgi:diphthamide biosynthesis protein 2